MRSWCHRCESCACDEQKSTISCMYSCKCAAFFLNPDQKCCNLCGCLYVHVTICVVDVIDVSLVHVMNKSQQCHACIFVNAQLFFSTQRSAAPAVLTVMVGPVLRGTLHFSSWRPCRCRRSKTYVKEKDTWASPIFSCVQSTQYPFEEDPSHGQFDDTPTRETKHVACSWLHRCVCTKLSVWLMW